MSLPTASSTSPSPVNTSQFGDYSNWAQQELAKGTSVSDIQGAINDAEHPSAAAGKQPSWWEKLLPTAGSIVGGIGGTLIGTAAAPFTGGLINPIDAGIAGSSFGDVAGRAGENELTGQNVKNDLGSSAIMGAVGQAGGDVLAPVLSGIAGGVSAGAGNIADKFVQGQEAPGFLTKSLSKLLRTNYGITNVAKSVPKIADAVTGSADNAEGALANKAVMDTLQSSPAPHLDVSDMFGNVDKKLQPIDLNQPSLTQQILNQTHGLNATDQKAIITNVETEFRKLPTSMGGQTDNVSAFNLSKALANKAGDIADQAVKASGSAKSSLQATSSVYDQLARELADRTLSPNGQDISLPAEGTQALKDNIVKAIGKDEPQAATQLSKDIDDLSNPDGSISAKNLRGFQAKWVVANKGLDASQQLADRFGGMTTADLAKSGLPIAGAIAGGGKGLVAGAAGAMTKSPSLDAGVAKGLDTISDLTSKGDNTAGSSIIKSLTGSKVNTNASILQKLIPVLSKSAAISTANLPNDIPATSGVSPTGAVNPSAANNTGGTMQGTSQQNDILSIYNTLLQQAQAPGAALLPNYGSMVSALTTLAPLAQKYQAASSIINNLTSGYANAGGAQGPLAGALTKATGVIPGTAASTYNTEQGSAAATIAQLLGISPQSATGMLPQLTQAPTVAAPQYQTLQSIFGGAGG